MSSGGAAVPATAARVALGVLALCTLINLTCRGVGESFAVFLLPLSRDFQAERAALTGIYSVYMLTHGLAAPAVGALFDRVGPRAVYCVGFICFALAYLLAGRAQALWQLYLALGLLSGIGTAALCMVPASALVSRWFRHGLPRAMSVLYAAIGIGVLSFAPLSQWLIDTIGWRSAYYAYGIAVLIALPLVMLAPWRRIAAGRPQPRGALAPQPPRAPVWNLRRAAREPAFWGLFGVFFVTSFSTFTINVQAVAYLVEVGFSAFESATVYGVAGVLSVFGMLTAGFLSERYGERRVATASYTCSILGVCALALLQWTPAYAALAAFVLLFGAMQGSRGPLISTLAARLFAGAGIGSIYGGLALGMGLGGALGSWSAGLLHDVTGGYGAGFVVSALGSVAGIAIFWKMGKSAEGR